MRKLTQCMKCIHQLGERKCLAFPKGIPYKILSDKIPHDQVFEDQTGDYIYTPKKEYEEYDLKLKEKYKISLAELEKLKTEIVQLFYHELTSLDLIKEDWDYAKLDIEHFANKRLGGKFNELSVVINGDKRYLNIFPSSDLTEKVFHLLSIKANHLNCNRFVLKIFPKHPALFEFI